MSTGVGEQERGAVSSPERGRVPGTRIPAKPFGGFGFRSDMGLGGGSVVGRKKNTLVCCDG